MSEDFDLGDINAFLQKLIQDPLRYLDQAQRFSMFLDASIEDRRMEMIKIPYQLAKEAKASPSVMQAILTSSFWEINTKAQKPKEKKIFLHCFEFCQGITKREGSGYQRSWTYASALTQFFDAEEDVDDLPALIKAGGGLEELAKNAGRRPIVKKVDGPPSELGNPSFEPELPDADRLDEEDEKDGSEDDGSQTPSDAGSTANEPTPDSLPEFDFSQDFILKGSPELMKKFKRRMDKKTIIFYGEIQKINDEYVDIVVNRIRYKS